MNTISSCELTIKVIDNGEILNINSPSSILSKSNVILLLQNTLTPYYNHTLEVKSKGNSDCHYESNSNGHVFLSINFCIPNIISGILKSNDDFYILSNKSGSYEIFQLTTNSHIICPSFHKHRHKRQSFKKGNFVRKPDYYDNYISDKKRYVELGLIADNSIYLKYNKDEKLVNARLQAIADFVNVLYSPLNIYVYLTYVEVWKDKDLINVSEESNVALQNLVEYRVKLMKHQPHDNTHLLTNKVFQSSVIGKAYKGTMCANDNSVGVDMDHNANPAYVAATVAHEMGHNFGMEHDAPYPDPCKCASPICIMYVASNLTLPNHWSECSLSQLSTSLSRGVDYCLMNVPKTKKGDSKCGNGIVEAGEDCDCGSTVHCDSSCCIPSTCKLSDNAECASGDCCDLTTCKPKKKAIMCRSPKSDCDLPEFCDGNSQYCPADFYVQDGVHCPLSPDSFCYGGYCGDRDKQCAKLWGAEVHNGVDICYKKLNVNGNEYGNCGYKNDTFFQCKEKDVFCGSLQCDNLNSQPIFGDPYSIRSVMSWAKEGEKTTVCRTFRTTYSINIKDRDPGMVPDGSKCGKDMFCVGTQCKRKNEVVATLPFCDPNDCNNLGICNNVGNCHCKYGYGGTACEIPGYGGSINSGPMHDTAAFRPFLWVMWFIIFAVAIFAGLSYYYKKNKNICLPKIIWKKFKNMLNIRGMLVPVRKAPAPPNRLPKPGENINAAWGSTEGGNEIHAGDFLTARFIPKPPSFKPPTCNYTDGGNYVQLSGPRNYFTCDRPKVPPPTAPIGDVTKLGTADNQVPYEIVNDGKINMNYSDVIKYPMNNININEYEMMNCNGTQRPSQPPPPVPKHGKKPQVAKKPVLNKKNNSVNTVTDGVDENIQLPREDKNKNECFEALPKINVKDLAKQFEKH
uniref:Peptidase M12B domain-containing protein n=1 Tax=Strongyloides papillosus TaxID=174720 RepID=A0A0N5BJR2_STREA